MTISASNRFPKSLPKGLPKSRRISIGGAYVLRFGSLNVKHQVYRKVLSKIITTLNNGAVNQQIFNRLTGQGLLDLVELASIRDQPCTNNMENLLWTFINRNPKDVLKFLTFLCNLEDMPYTARKIRKLIESEFPNSVLLAKRRKSAFISPRKNDCKGRRISSTLQRHAGNNQDQENCGAELKRPVSKCKGILNVEKERKNHKIKVAENKTIPSCLSARKLLVKQHLSTSLIHFTNEQFGGEGMSHSNDSFDTYSVLSFENEHTSSSVSHFAHSNTELAMHKENPYESFTPDSDAIMTNYEGIMLEKDCEANAGPEQIPLVKTQACVIVNESHCESCWQKFKNAFTLKNTVYVAAAGFLVCGTYFLAGNQSSSNSINDPYGEFPSQNISSTYSPGIEKTEIEQNGRYSYNFSLADALDAQKPKSD